MQILDNVIIIGLIVLAFIAGLKLAGHYYERLMEEERYANKILAVKGGYGYIAPPEKRHVPIGQPFMDKLKENGRATQALRSSQH